MKKVYWVIALILLLGCSFAEPRGDFSSIYCDVNDKLNSIQSFEECISRNTSTIPSDHMLYEGHLYLRLQSTRSTPLVVQVDKPEWNIEKLDELAVKNPDLLPYFPDINAPNKGITLIKK